VSHAEIVLIDGYVEKLVQKRLAEQRTNEALPHVVERNQTMVLLLTEAAELMTPHATYNEWAAMRERIRAFMMTAMPARHVSGAQCADTSQGAMVGDASRGALCTENPLLEEVKKACDERDTERHERKRLEDALATIANISDDVLARKPIVSTVFGWRSRRTSARTMPSR
jgi:hypothetical protein